MIETAAIFAVITEAIEVVAIPAIATWAVGSEVIGASRSKHNSIVQLALGLIKAIAKEATEQSPEPEVEIKKPIRKKPTAKQRLHGSAVSKPATNRRGRKID